jgi:murein L,D-transpeptidase YafK
MVAKRNSLFLLIAFCLCTLAIADSAAPSPTKVDKVVVLKKERRLELHQNGTVLRTYRIALGGNPLGAKMQQGDQKTPEGLYVIDSRNPNSAFHKSLHVSYPNKVDIANARARKVKPGGDIYIHGLGQKFGWIGSKHTLRDWTLGCIAVTNDEIEEIWRLVPNGTPIEIRP